MSPAARSLFVFAFYPMTVGLALLFVPNLALGLVGVPPSGEAWIRVVGMLALFEAYHDFTAALQDDVGFMRASSHVRLTVLPILGGLVLLADAPWILVLIGLFDLGGAVWTLTALRESST